MKPYVMLAFAIISEVTGATMLKLSEGFTHPVFTVLAISGYVISLVILGFTLKYLPLGIAYAIWGGVGTILTALVGAVAWHDTFGWMSALGLALVVGGDRFPGDGRTVRTRLFRVERLIEQGTCFSFISFLAMFKCYTAIRCGGT